MFEGKSVAELNDIMEAVKVELGNAKERERKEADGNARSMLDGVEKGTAVRVIFKGEEVEAVFEKLTDKRFTVKIDGVNKSIMFDKLVSVG